MTNSYRGEIDVKGVGQLRFTWDRIAQLRDELGGDFDEKITKAAMENDVVTMAAVVAIGTGLSAEKVNEASPPIIPTFNAIIAALNLAFHGETQAPKVSKKKPTTTRKPATQ